MKKLSYLLIIVPAILSAVTAFESCKRDTFNQLEIVEKDPYADFKPLYAPIRLILN